MNDVLVNVTSEYTAGERRVNLSLSIAALKDKLELTTGIPPSHQKLRVYTETGEIRTLAPVETLGESGISDGWRIHVVDTRPLAERLDLRNDDTPKFEMSPEEYARRSDSVLAWKKKNQLGRFGSSSTDDNPQSGQAGPASYPEIRIGSKCHVHLKSGQLAQGIVAYMGDIPDLPSGTWVGMRLDTPDGKNNGTVLGHNIFDAPENHGVCVRPWQVTPMRPEEEEL